MRERLKTSMKINSQRFIVALRQLKNCSNEVIFNEKKLVLEKSEEQKRSSLLFYNRQRHGRVVKSAVIDGDRHYRGSKPSLAILLCPWKSLYRIQNCLKVKIKKNNVLKTTLNNLLKRYTENKHVYYQKKNQQVVNLFLLCIIHHYF